MEGLTKMLRWPGAGAAWIWWLYRVLRSRQHEKFHPRAASSSQGVCVKEALLEVAQKGGEVAYYEVLDQMSFPRRAKGACWGFEVGAASNSVLIEIGH